MRDDIHGWLAAQGLDLVGRRVIAGSSVQPADLLHWCGNRMLGSKSRSVRDSRVQVTRNLLASDAPTVPAVLRWANVSRRHCGRLTVGVPQGRQASAWIDEVRGA